MIYWLFTEGRELLSSFLIPLSCLTLLMPLVVSAVFGAGIQRSGEVQSLSGWKRRLKSGEGAEPLLLERGISLDLPALPPTPAEAVKRDKLREAYQLAMDKAGEKADNTRFTRMDEMRRKHQERKRKAEAVV